MSIKLKLANGEDVCGTWVSLSDPSVIEILCQSGFDFLLVDGEHTPISDDELKTVVVAAHGFDTKIIYRVRENNTAMIKIALDLGVDGIMIPMVNSKLDAQKAVNSSKYPPVGLRGIGPWRASNYYDDLLDYTANANDRLTLILQIENAEALPHLSDILTVDGIDALYVGPADLSASLGVFPDTSAPIVQEKIQEIISNCQQAGMPVGIDIGDIDTLEEFHKKGARLFTYGMDVSYIFEGARSASALMRKMLK